MVLSHGGMLLGFVGCDGVDYKHKVAGQLSYVKP